MSVSAFFGYRTNIGRAILYYSIEWPDLYSPSYQVYLRKDTALTAVVLANNLLVIVNSSKWLVCGVKTGKKALSLSLFSSRMKRKT